MLLDYLRRGVVAGVATGLVFGLFLALVATPLVGFADGMAHDGAAGDHATGTAEHHAAENHEADGQGDGSTHHESAVPATVTDLVSVLSGVLWAVLLGGVVFGAGYYLLEPTIPGSEATRSYVLAAAGFLSVSGAPWLVLPPLPPGTEQAVGTDLRLALYGGMMLAGAVVSLLSFGLYDRLRAQRGPLLAGAASLPPLGLLGVPVLLAPTNAGATSLPASLSTGLTGTVVFGQALLWLLLAAAHTGLRRRAAAEDRPDAVGDGYDRATPGD